MLQRLKKEFYEFRLLMKSIPTVLTALFIIAVFTMNLLANKSIDLPFDWLALDCGIIISWFAFLTMDIITKHFGPKASTEISLLAIFINLILCFILFISSIIPGTWSEAYVEGDQGLINTALDNTFGGTWYVLMGSTIAFIVSAIVNNFSNWGLGKLFHKHSESIGVYFFRTYVSTALGQFVDNIIFALIVSYFFFGWTILQCLTCAITGMIVELLCEIVFSYFGYKICNKWKEEKVGEEYFLYLEKERKD